MSNYTTNREKLTLCLEATVKRFPRPGGLKGIAYEEGLREVRNMLKSLPDSDIEELIKEYRIYLWSM